MAEKNATLRALIEGVVYDLMVKSNVYNIKVTDTETLADKLQEVINAVNASVKLTDIVNDLTTGGTEAPLSAEQGKTLKALIDAIDTGDVTVPTLLSQLENDVGFITEIWVTGQLENYVATAELQTAVDTALAQAKESGEFDGADGTSVTVTSVSESTADGGSNVVTFSDGKTVTIKNGLTGSPGKQGESGQDGYTPVKGTDYWTVADRTEMVNDVLAALPEWEGGNY